jgi:hypothetical protein
MKPLPAFVGGKEIKGRHSINESVQYFSARNIYWQNKIYDFLYIPEDLCSRLLLRYSLFSLKGLRAS